MVSEISFKIFQCACCIWGGGKQMVFSRLDIREFLKLDDEYMGSL